MTKHEIANCLNKYYTLINKSIIHGYLRDIYMYEKTYIMKKFIKEVVFQNKNISLFLNENYISESTFYRLKNQLIDKLYHLLILDNKVSKEEILSD